MIVQRGFPAPPSYHTRPAAGRAGATLLRRDHQRLRRDVLLCVAGRAARPLGDRRLCAGAAGIPGREARRRARCCGASCHEIAPSERLHAGPWQTGSLRSASSCWLRRKAVGRPRLVRADGNPAAGLARGVCDLELRPDRQHDSAADPSPDRRRMGICCSAGAAAGGRHDPAGCARLRARACRAARRSIPGPPIRPTIPADVARWYLNGPSFLIRAADRAGRLVVARHRVRRRLRQPPAGRRSAWLSSA